ncbi:hypothetical protein AMATHDRAFT_5809 [Amanita thiersii Skay4041]|uniref:Uncharacterized protein n=1 Tax=Amanita thiersii Skay4041 TaxID=703135 RepID=A0A2A9NL00_9AGAR|nr:hypothetical protein AMATHDRAFT_5809 [Amanita thiersii Skay4041]
MLSNGQLAPRTIQWLKEDHKDFRTRNPSLNYAFLDVAFIKDSPIKRPGSSLRSWLYELCVHPKAEIKHLPENIPYLMGVMAHTYASLRCPSDRYFISEIVIHEKLEAQGRRELLLAKSAGPLNLVKGYFHIERVPVQRQFIHTNEPRNPTTFTFKFRRGQYLSLSQLLCLANALNTIGEETGMFVQDEFWFAKATAEMLLLIFAPRIDMNGSAIEKAAFQPKSDSLFCDEILKEYDYQQAAFWSKVEEESMSALSLTTAIEYKRSSG